MRLRSNGLAQKEGDGWTRLGECCWACVIKWLLVIGWSRTDDLFECSGLTATVGFKRGEITTRNWILSRYSQGFPSLISRPQTSAIKDGTEGLRRVFLPSAFHHRPFAIQILYFYFFFSFSREGEKGDRGGPGSFPIIDHRCYFFYCSLNSKPLHGLRVLFFLSL